MDEVTCGGNALIFYAAVRLRLVRMGLLKSEDKVNFISFLVVNRRTMVLLIIGCLLYNFIFA